VNCTDVMFMARYGDNPQLGSFQISRVLDKMSGWDNPECGWPILLLIFCAAQQQ
jgi:hypothetical protein